MTHAPGSIRDSIVAYLSGVAGSASVGEIQAAIARQIGNVPASSIRSYLNLNTPEVFERTGRGHYKLKVSGRTDRPSVAVRVALRIGLSSLYEDDCFDWLSQQASNSVHAVVTDPPYGLVEYTEEQQQKLRNGHGGVWRIPPSFDGCVRSPLPRFTILNEGDRRALHGFFGRLGALLARVTVPGANIVIASNPLLAHIVVDAMASAGLEPRGTIVRLVMTMRGGDRPKNAHHEFPDVSVLPRSMWEPWVVLRNPLEGRVQDNLRKWRTGGFRRPSSSKPFGDVIRSSPTPAGERRIAPHPSLKPQFFLRQIVRAVLPLGEGIILDPFAGSGSTLAAANALGYNSIGVEMDARYIETAAVAISRLSALRLEIDPVGT